jgi:hypothetical protein
LSLIPLLLFLSLPSLLTFYLSLCPSVSLKRESLLILVSKLFPATDNKKEKEWIKRFIKNVGTPANVRYDVHLDALCGNRDMSHF